MMKKRAQDSSNYDIFRLKAIVSGYPDSKYGALKSFISTVPNTCLQPYHEKMLALMCSGDFSLMNVCRQCGTTHMLELFALFSAISRDNTNVLYVLTGDLTGDLTCRDTFGVAMRILNSIPKDSMLVDAEFPSSFTLDPSIKLSNGSKITFGNYLSLNTLDDAHYADVTLFDNCAHYNDDNRFNEIYRQALRPERVRVLASTPYKKVGLFWEMCKRARENIRCNGSYDRYLEISGEEVFGKKWKKWMDDVAWTANADMMKTEFGNEFL